MGLLGAAWRREASICNILAAILFFKIRSGKLNTYTGYLNFHEHLRFHSFLVPKIILSISFRIPSHITSTYHSSILAFSRYLFPSSCSYQAPKSNNKTSSWSLVYK
jgi:hypothetical protein